MAAPAGAQFGEYIQYGAAFLYINPNAANLATPTMPIFPFTVQDAGFDIKGKADELRGQLRNAEDVAVGDLSVTGKFGIGRKDFLLLNQILFADTSVTGGTTVSPLEAHTIPATPYEVTIAPPGTGTFVEDLGVMYALTGERFQAVSGSLTGAGQYKVDADTGIYTFDAADTLINVVISYSYSLASGVTFEVNNQIQGYGPQCEFFFVDRYALQAGISNCMWIKAVKVHSVSGLGNKRDKYAMAEVEYTAFVPGPLPGQSLFQAFVAAG